jgi:small conductance mechanosensitive channel
METTNLTRLVGAAGLAIGLALQGTLSNVAAGVLLFFALSTWVMPCGSMAEVYVIDAGFFIAGAPARRAAVFSRSQIWRPHHR